MALVLYGTLPCESDIRIVTNRKSEQRHGKVQLIDATQLKSPLRKNPGEKNCEVTEEIRKQILDIYTRGEECDKCKIFPNNEFGFWVKTLESDCPKDIKSL